jgi:hypothetical protein
MKENSMPVVQSRVKAEAVAVAKAQDNIPVESAKQK